MHRLLTEEVLPWITESLGIRCVFPQGGAPSHASNSTSRGAKIRHRVLGRKHVTTLSPDINPMDFAVWSILERDVSADSYSSVAALRNALHPSFEADGNKKCIDNLVL